MMKLTFDLKGMIVCLLFCLFAQVGIAQEVPKAVIYGGKNYSGNSAKLRTGSFAINDIKKKGIYTVRSITVQKGYKVMVHYATASSKTIYTSRTNLDVNDFLGIEVLRMGTSSNEVSADREIPKAVVYGYSNFKGNSAKMRIGSFKPYQVEKAGVNKIRSVQLKDGYKMVVSYYGKPDEVISATDKTVSIENYKSISVRPTVRKATSSSIDMSPEPSASTYAIVTYNITGKSVKLRPGKADQDDLLRHGVRFIQQIDKIPAGYKLILYPLNDYGGTPKTFYRSNIGKLNKLYRSAVLKKI